MPQCAICQVECTLRCSRVAYCSAAHQKEHWPTHKASCKAASATSSSTPSAPAPAPAASSSTPRTTPRSAASRGAPTLNLHTMPTSSPADFMSALTPFPPTLGKQQAYERLIDAFRLWCDDCAIWNGHAFGLYAEEDPYPEFVQFVKKARKHLPAWWSNADDAAVLKMCRMHDWANIAYAVEKSDINEHYGSPMFAMGIRMWTEKVTGVKIG
ncbi:hypothetical protein JCM10449v2_001689 [Rhodotorula kratochvilovae]